MAVRKKNSERTKRKKRDNYNTASREGMSGRCSLVWHRLDISLSSCGEPWIQAAT